MKHVIISVVITVWRQLDGFNPPPSPAQYLDPSVSLPFWKNMPENTACHFECNCPTHRNLYAEYLWDVRIWTEWLCRIETVNYYKLDYRVTEGYFPHYHAILVLLIRIVVTTLTTQHYHCRLWLFSSYTDSFWGIYSVAEPRGGTEGHAPPTVDRHGHRIRANPRRLFGGASDSSIQTSYSWWGGGPLRCPSPKTPPPHRTFGPRHRCSP